MCWDGHDKWLQYILFWIFFVNKISAYTLLLFLSCMKTFYLQQYHRLSKAHVLASVFASAHTTT